MIDWDQELDDRQLEAVTYGAGPLKVIAGAGSGKTRTLMHRAAHLQQVQSVSSEDLLLITFTKAAAREMQERSRALGITEMEISTQHSWAIRSLRPFCATGTRSLLGCCDLLWEKNGEKRYPILTDSFYMDAWKKAAKVAGVPHASLPHYDAAKIVSRAKNCMVTREKLSESKDENDRFAAHIWGAYTERCILDGKMDFDDILVELAKIMGNPGVAIQLQHRHPWVLVDEVQDLSPIQWRIIELLCPAPNANLTIVGDDDQSIYGFRGAEPGKLITFEDRYNAKVIVLEQNYRSTKSIVASAAKLIAHNTDRQNKTVYSVIEHERLPSVRISLDESIEADDVRRQIEIWCDLGYEYRDIAVLVRCWWQTRSFEEAFISNDIPYIIMGGKNFYRRKEIQTLIRYFRLAVDPFDTEALMGSNLASSVLNIPLRYMGKAAYRQLATATKRCGAAYPALLSCPWSQSFMTRSARELYETISMLHTWYTAHKPTAEDLLRHIELLLNFEEYLREAYEHSEDRIDNVHALYGVGGNHPDPIEFIEFTLQMFESLSKPTTAKNVVQVMSIHRAKGREFSCVAAVGFSDGVLPHFKSGTSDEERRLAYVAITRAKRELLVSGALSYRDRDYEVSPFVQQLGSLQRAAL